MPYSLYIYFFVFIGVAVSVLLPVMREILDRSLKNKDITLDTWYIVRNFIIIGLFSLLAALVVVAYFGDAISTWQEGFIAGYTVDSTLQKLVDPKSETVKSFFMKFPILHPISKAKSQGKR